MMMSSMSIPKTPTPWMAKYKELAQLDNVAKDVAQAQRDLRKVGDEMGHLEGLARGGAGEGGLGGRMLWWRGGGKRSDLRGGAREVVQGGGDWLTGVLSWTWEVWLASPLPLYTKWDHIHVHLCDMHVQPRIPCMYAPRFLHVHPFLLRV